MSQYYHIDVFWWHVKGLFNTENKTERTCLLHKGRFTRRPKITNILSSSNVVEGSATDQVTQAMPWTIL